MIRYLSAQDDIARAGTKQPTVSPGSDGTAAGSLAMKCTADRLRDGRSTRLKLPWNTTSLTRARAELDTTPRPRRERDVPAGWPAPWRPRA